MGIEGIEHQRTACGLGRRHVYHLTDAGGPVALGPARRDPSMPSSSPRFATQKRIAHPCTLLCIVLAVDSPRGQWQGSVDRANQLFAGFVHAYDRRGSSGGPVGEPHDVLHVLDECGSGFGPNAPRCHLPKMELGLFHAWRTVSRAARATYPRSTSRSASQRTGQRPCRLGGSPQARAITCCATSPLMVTGSGRLRGGGGLRAASTLSSTQCCRTRWRVERRTPNASAMASSVYLMPSGLASACSKMRPWSSWRAAPLPDATILRSKQRASSVRVTRNLAMGDLLRLKPPCVVRRRIDPDQPVNRRLPSY